MRISFRLAVASFICLAATMLAATAASAAPKTWVNTATLKCLDSNAGGDVYALGCNGGPYQSWVSSGLNFGDQIQDAQTGRCLDSNGAKRVYTGPCNGGSYQQWQVTDRGQFGYEIRDVATGFCLDSNGSGQVYTHGCNGGNYQRWR
ncbi:RICIN domain-containing protein [Frankia sp. AiPs1]|uniref:RICIN domain-containing protein n=1 Tax=Frankia sp. AiPs1 TaxID=573493 RepID=UPI0020445635|nr:RICIN domain-containing protein [Frankia sp. AiPs1]MCM3922025.1 RICIN domain-containing protein [Frankia sp. AiPs1]